MLFCEIMLNLRKRRVVETEGGKLLLVLVVRLALASHWDLAKTET